MTTVSKRGQISMFTVRDVTLVGMMAAVIFAATMFLRIPITLPGGDATQLKAANALCLLAGFLLGPVRGGLAAGIGSMFFDLTNPMFISSAPFTFVFFFLMGFVCGSIAHAGNAQAQNKTRNILAACAGAFGYVFLYLSKSFISLLIAGSAPAAALTAVLPKIAASVTNATFAVVVSLLLLPVLYRPIRRLLP